MASDKENPKFQIRASLPSMPSSSGTKALADDLTPRKRARRSQAPRKSILKFVNGLDDPTQELPSMESTDQTQSIDSTGGRKSLARRVSFAAHAQVRLFNKEATSNGTPDESPNSAIPSAPAAPASTSNPSRRSSIMSAVRRRSTSGKRPSLAATPIPEPVGDDYDEENSSMDIEEDYILDNAPMLVSQEIRQTRGYLSLSPGDSRDEDGEGQDMEFTSVFNNSIILASPSSQPSAAVTRSNTLPQLEPLDEGEAMEFTVALEQSILPSKRASAANEAWAQLQALTPQPEQDEPPVLLQGKVHSGMTSELTAAGQLPPHPFEDTGSFPGYLDNSTDSSHLDDEGFCDDQTMDLTSIVQPQYLMDEDVEPHIPEHASTSAPLSTPPLSKGTPPLERSTSGSSSSPPIIGSPMPRPLSPPGRSPLPIFQPQLNSSSLGGVDTPFPLALSTQPVDEVQIIESSQSDHSVSLIGAVSGLSADFLSQELRTQSGAANTTASNSSSPLPTSPSIIATNPMSSTSQHHLPHSHSQNFLWDSSRMTHPNSHSSSKRAASPAETAPAKKRVVGEGPEDRRAIPGLPVSEALDGQLQSLEQEAEAGGSHETTSRPSPYDLQTSAQAPKLAMGHRLSSFALRMGRKSTVSESISIVPGPGSSHAPPQSLLTPEDGSQDHPTQPTGHNEETDRALLEPTHNPMGPKISLDEVLDLAGIHFHEDMPVQRRHTLGPNVMAAHNGMLRSTDSTSQDFCLADYYSAEAVDLALLDIYTWAIQEIKNQMNQHKQELSLLSEEIEENPPNALLDFLEADEELRMQIETVFKLAKTYAKRTTRGEWYRWRSKWTGNLQRDADIEEQNLMSHLDFVEEQRSKLEAPVGELQQQHAILRGELDKERAAIAQIEACDPEQLEGLKAGILEQSVAVEGYKGDIADATMGLQRSALYLEDKQTELKIARGIIGSSKRQGDALDTTRDDVLLGQAGFHQLQDLHQWRIIGISSTSLEWEHKSLFRVTLPCHGYKPIAGNTSISKVPSQAVGNQFAVVLDVMMKSGSEALNYVRYRCQEEVVRHLDIVWGSFDKALAELRLLDIRYPLEILPMGGGNGLVVNVDILVRPNSNSRSKAKAVVTFLLKSSVLSQWPSSASQVDVLAQVLYGSVSADNIIAIVKDRLISSTLSESYGSLLDACQEIQNI